MTDEKNLHIEGHRVNWADHADAIIVGPFIEERMKNIRQALLDMNQGKLSMLACLQVVALEVFSQEEIAAYAKDDKAVIP